MISFYLLSRPENHVLPLPGMLEVIEAKTLDWRFRLRGVRSPGDEIVIVAVDEQIEDELGRWQSTGRRWLAQLLDVLTAAQAKVIGFDLTLAEPDKGPVPDLIENIKTQFTETSANAPAFLAYLDTIQAEHDYDRQLAEALRRADNVILGMYHYFNQASAQYLSPEKRAESARFMDRVKYKAVYFPPGISPQPLTLRHSFGVEMNLPLFSEAARSFGHVTLQPEIDGYIRSVPLLIEYEGRYCPAFTLEILRTALNSPMPPVIHAGQTGAGAVNQIQLDRIMIPTDEHGQALLNFYGGSGTFPIYALSDVLQGEISAVVFQDKYVLVGVTGNIYQDTRPTAFDQSHYGVEIHATLLANLLQHNLLVRPEDVRLLDVGLLALLAIGLGIALQFIHSFRWGVMSAIFSLSGVFAIAYGAFVFERVWLNLTFPYVFIVLDYFAITAYKYFVAEKKRRVIKQAFEYYIAPALVKRILETSETPVLGQEQRDMTVFFSDIRGFTTMSEKMSSQEISQFLAEFFDPMIEIVAAHGGTVDKYIGDAIMVLYGAPEHLHDHAIQACKTAVEMLIRLNELKPRWQARGLPELNIGLGINSGEMSVGNIGSKAHFNYTVLGDNVNLASRLEGVNKQYGTNLIISQFTYNRLPPEQFTVRELDTIRVKGKTAPVVIYELLGYGSYFLHLKPLVDRFSAGIAAYKQRQWAEALEIFGELTTQYPQDGPSKLYRERCQRYRWEPPPDDWNGVFEMKTK